MFLIIKVKNYMKRYKAVKETIKDWPAQIRPRERLWNYGVEALSDVELLAILISTGIKEKTAVDIAYDILKKHNFSQLLDFSPEQLNKILGLGKAKVTRILAALEISKRLQINKFFSNPFINSPEDVATLFMPLLKNEKKEQFFTVLLDTKNRFINKYLISLGSLNEASIHPREVFRPAIKDGANSVILVHNHPSGDTSPSSDDIDITRQLIVVGRLIETSVVDHVIIGNNSYCSLYQTTDLWDK